VGKLHYGKERCERVNFLAVNKILKITRMRAAIDILTVVGEQALIALRHSPNKYPSARIFRLKSISFRLE
jgi:hypothetical protein